MLNTSSSLSLFLCLSPFSVSGRACGGQRGDAGPFLLPELGMGCVLGCSGRVCQRNKGRRNLQDLPGDLVTGFCWQTLWIVTWGYKRRMSQTKGS